jgi:hypothetical protein
MFGADPALAKLVVMDKHRLGVYPVRSGELRARDTDVLVEGDTGAIQNPTTRSKQHRI